MRQQQQVDYSQFSVGELVDHVLNQLKIETDSAEPQERRFAARSGIDEVLNAISPMAVHPNREIARAVARLERTVALQRNRIEPKFEDGNPISAAQLANDPAAKLWLKKGEYQDKYIGIGSFDDTMLPTGGTASDLAENYDPVAGFLTGKHDDIVDGDLAGVADLDEALATKLGIDPAALGTRVDPNDSELIRRALIYGGDVQEENGRRFIQSPDGTRLPLPDLSVGRKVSAVLGDGSRAEFTITDSMIDRLNEAAGRNFLSNTIVGGGLDLLNQNLSMVHGIQANFHDIEVLTPYGKRRVPRITGNAAIDSEIYQMPEFQRASELLAPERGLGFAIGQSIFSNVEYGGLMFLTSLGLKGAGKAAQKIGLGRVLAGASSAFGKNRMSTFAKMTQSRIGKAIVEGGRPKGNWMAPGMRYDTMQLGEEVYYNVVRDAVNGRWEPKKAFSEGVSEWAGEFVLSRTSRALRRVASRALDTKALRGIGERLSPVVTDNSALKAAMDSVDAARKAGSDKLAEAAKRGMFGEVGRHMRAEQLGQMFDSWFVGHSFGAWSAAQQMAAVDGRDWDHMSLGDKAGYFMQGTVSAEALGSGIGMIGTQVGYTSLANGPRNPVRALFDPEYIAANSGNPKLDKTADDMAQFLLHITGQQQGDLDPNVVTLIDGVWDFEATSDEKAARLQRLADTVRGNEPLTEPELAARDIDAELNTISIEQISSLFDRENGPEIISAAAARLTGDELTDQVSRARTEISALSADPAALAENSERITKLRQYSDVLVDELTRRARGEAGGRGQTEEVEWVDEEGEVLDGPFNEEPNPMSLPDANDLKAEELGQFFSEGIEKLEDGKKIRTWTVKAPKWRNAGRSAYSQTTIYQATDGNETFLTFDLNKDLPDPTFPNTPEGLEAAMRAATVAAGVLTADDKTRVGLGRKPLTEAGRILAGMKPKTGPAQLLAKLLSQPELQNPSTVLKLETLDRGDPEQGVLPGSVSMLVDAIRQDADGRRALREVWRNAIYRNVLESKHRDPREPNPVDVITEERIERDLRSRVKAADADIKRKDKEIADQNARAAKEASRTAKAARSAEAELERERKKLEREQRLRDKIEEREDAKSKLEKLKAELRAAKEATKRVRAEAKLAKDRLKLEREKLKLDAAKATPEATTAAMKVAVKLEEKAKAEKKKARKERAVAAKATAETLRADPTPASTAAAKAVEKTAEVVNKISEAIEAVVEKADKKAVEEGRTDPPTQLELDSIKDQIRKALGEIEYVNAEKRDAAEAAILSSSQFMSADGLRKQLKVLQGLAKKSKEKRSKAPVAAPVQTLSGKRNRATKAERVRKKAAEQVQQAKEAVQQLADAGRPVDPAVEQKIMAVANAAAAEAEAAAAKLDPATEVARPGTNPLRDSAAVQLGAEPFTGRARAKKVGVGTGENLEPGRMFETLLFGLYTQLEGAVNPDAKSKHTGMVAGFIIGAGLTKGGGKGTNKDMHRAIGDLFGMSAEEVELVRSALELEGAAHDALIMQRLAAIKSDGGDPLIDLERAKSTWLPALRILAIAPDGTIPERGRGALIADEKAAHMMRGWWQQTGRNQALEAAKQYADRNGKSFDAGQMAETIDRLWETRMARISLLSGQGKSKRGGKQEPKQFTPIVSQVVNMITESYLGDGKRNVNDSYGIRIGGELVQLRDVAIGVIESIRTGRTLESALELSMNTPTEQEGDVELRPAAAEDMTGDAEVDAAIESIDPVDTEDPMDEAARNAHHHYNIAQRTLEDFNERVVKELGMEVPIGDMDKVTRLLRDANDMFLEGGEDANGLQTPDTESMLFKSIVLTITKDDNSEEKALEALDAARELCSMARRISSASQEAAVQMIAASIPVDSAAKGEQVKLMQDRIRLGFFMHDYASRGGDDEKLNTEILESCKTRFGFDPFEGDEKQPVVAVRSGGKVTLRPGKAFATRAMRSVYTGYVDVLKRMGLHTVGARDRTGKVQQPMTYMFGGFPATPEMAKTFVHFLAGVVNFSTGYGARVFGLDARSLADSDVHSPALISPKRLLESMNRGDSFWAKAPAARAIVERLVAPALKLYQKYWIGYRGVRGIGTTKTAESNEKLIGAMNSANFEANEMMARAQKLMRTAREWNLHTSEYRLMGDLLAHGAVTRFRNAEEFEKVTGRKGSGRLYEHMVEWNKLLMEMGQHMVELGIISPEQFQQRENEYLPKRMVQLAYGEGGLNYFVNGSDHTGGDPVSASEKHTTTDEGSDFSVRMYDIRYTMPVTVARVAKRIELFRALHQMRREGVVLTKSDYEALTPIEKAQYTRLANRGLSKTMDGQMIAKLTREEETDLAEGRMSPVEKDRLLEERRNTTLEAAMVQTMIDEERKSRVENNIAHPRMMELLDSLEGGFVTWHALREISFMLERTETNGPMSSDTISVLADKAQQVSVEWRQLRTVQNPRHWMLQFFTNLATNAISGKVPIGDMLTSLTTGEGTYADAAWAMTEWHQQKSQGVKREDMTPDAAEFDAFVEKMGGATLSHLINDPVRPSDLILSMFYNADGTPLYGTSMTEALAEAGGVPVALSRAGRGHANYSTSIRNLSMSANPAARAEAIRGLVGIYNLHELWWKYAATIEGQKRGLSFDAAVRWGAEGTGDFSDRNTTLMRMTTSFTMGTSRLRDKAYEKIGSKQGGLNKRLMARQLISMGVATPFWMYRASMIPTMARYSLSWRGVLGAAFATLGIRMVGAAFGGDDEDLLESSAGSDILRDFDPNDQAVEIFKRRHGMAKLPGFGGGGYDNQFAIAISDWVDYWKAFGNNLMHVGTLGAVGQHDMRGEMLTAARGPTVGGGSTMLNMRDFVPMVGEVNDLSAGDMPFVGTMFSGKSDTHDSRYGFGLMASSVTAGVLNLMRLYNGEEGKTRANILAEISSDLAAQFTAPMGGSSFLPAAASKEYQVLYGETAWDGRSFGEWTAGLPRARQESTLGEALALVAARSTLPVVRVNSMSRAPRLTSQSGRPAQSQIPEVAAAEQRNSEIRSSIAGLFGRAYRESLDDPTVPHAARVSSLLDLSGDLVATPGGGYDVLAQPRSELGRWLRARGASASERWPWVRDTLDALDTNRRDLDRLISGPDGLVYRRDVDPALHDRMVRAVMRKSDNPMAMMRFIHQQLREDDGRKGPLLARLWATTGAAYERPTRPEDIDMWDWANKRVQEISRGSTVDIDTSGMPTDAELRSIVGSGVYDVSPEAVIRSRPRKSAGELRAKNPFPNLTR